MAGAGNVHIIVTSMIVFFFLNFFENLIHFSVGRNVENKDKSSLALKMPNKYDFIKILIIMIVFSILQGVLTYILDKIL
jgi:hypothetical protein